MSKQKVTNISRGEEQSFGDIVRQIAYNAFHYGINSVGRIDRYKASRRERRRFIAACHKGYQRAQDALVERILEVEQAQADLKQLIKTAHRDRHRAEAHQLEVALASLEYKEAILRSIANGIAWALLGARRWIVRRLALSDQPTPLRSSNLKLGLEFVASINKNPMDFALLTDLTSCIQVGDVLLTRYEGDDAGIHFVELKEGEKNRTVLEFLESWSHTRCAHAMALFAIEHGEETLKQADRIVRQHARGAQVINILKTDEGIDPATGAPVRIRGPELLEEDYDEAYPDAIAQARQSGEYVFVVDKCLWVGVYDHGQIGDPMLAFKHHLHHTLLNQEDCFLPENTTERLPQRLQELEIVPYPIVPLVSTVTSPTATPIFIRRISLDDQVALVTGAISILIYIDWDGLLAQASERGLRARWQTRKERGKSQQFSRSSRQGHGYFGKTGLPVFSREGESITIVDGVVMRMMDGMRPSSVLDLIDSMLRNASEIRNETHVSSDESSEPTFSNGGASFSPQ